jgi:hypothetical protein
MARTWQDDDSLFHAAHLTISPFIHYSVWPSPAGEKWNWGMWDRDMMRASGEAHTREDAKRLAEKHDDATRRDEVCFSRN